jgi:hypothetical protein
MVFAIIAIAGTTIFALRYLRRRPLLLLGMLAGMALLYYVAIVVSFWFFALTTPAKVDLSKPSITVTEDGEATDRRFGFAMGVGAAGASLLALGVMVWIGPYPPPPQK